MNISISISDEVGGVDGRRQMTASAVAIAIQAKVWLLTSI
jgi:hypothetical protein